ncbi:hypothetical protein CAPTEDRAFT_218354 [Capitella teleta]|uniref:F5/8 type C domain-containing protein n=1 Tax=Capitella teleta TaxID=283909 RepID=R7UU45_CAPTE|nr:hypothetical protein CAPTEDRAFT_218354 [Capitella teleta]|eukprot:ELU06921.1 hypothetical protein CAPTEDRAFT_218354 [Capitella teleta]
MCLSNNNIIHIMFFRFYLCLINTRNKEHNSDTNCESMEWLPLVAGVTDEQLTASTDYDDELIPANSRLTDVVGWCPLEEDFDPWLQVTFEDLQKIVGIRTLGSGKFREYVKTYEITYTSDGTAWGLYGAFMGNSAEDIPKTHDFNPPPEALAMRFYPKEYYKGRTVRWELYTCPTPAFEEKTRDNYEGTIKL